MIIQIDIVRGGRTDREDNGEFLGREDPSISEKGLRELKALGRESSVDIVFSSPLARCTEASPALYGRTTTVEPELTAINYGIFTGKTMPQLLDMPEFNSWVKNPLITSIPGGENPFGFQSRCMTGFKRVTSALSTKGVTSAGIITHTAVIKTLIRRLCLSRFDYYSPNIEHGRGFRIGFDTIMSTTTSIDYI